MEIEIRRATTGDIKSVQRLSLLLFEKQRGEFDTTLNLEWPFSEEGEIYFRKSITEDDQCVFVACVDDNIIGFLNGCIDEKDSNRSAPRFSEMDYLFVLDEYRGNGIGTKLYRAFLNWCQSKNIKRLRVTASAGNSGAINFYRKNGFTDYDLVLEQNI